jgi:hypothetical protein
MSARAPHCVDSACEFDQHAIARRLDNAPAVVAMLGSTSVLGKPSIVQASAPRSSPSSGYSLRRPPPGQPPIVAHAVTWQDIPHMGQFTYQNIAALPPAQISDRVVRPPRPAKIRSFADGARTGYVEPSGPTRRITMPGAITSRGLPRVEARQQCDERTHEFRNRNRNERSMGRKYQNISRRSAIRRWSESIAGAEGA